MPASRPLLHERFAGLRESLPHLRLGRGPTPVRPLARLVEDGPPLWLKDDGAFGDGPWGGNKVRKLEWLLPDAMARGRRTILTIGALGTNHGLATALYARARGLDVALVLVDQPVDEHVREHLERLRASGATLHFTHGRARTLAALPWLIVRHWGRRPPYVLPPGGSTPVGALGYVEAGLEIAGQVADGALPEPSHAVVPVGSGGTAAGLMVGLRLGGLRTRVLGVVVNDALRLDPPAISRLAARTERLLRARGAGFEPLEPRAEDLTVSHEWLGRGYGHPTAESRAAIALAREREGLELDPVYTAKAVAALGALARRGELGDGPVLYVHTYGPRVK